MNILGFNIHISRAAQAAPAQKALGATPEAWLRGEAPDGPMLSNAYEQVVWVYRAINVLAEQVANVPFLFSAGERGRENLITSGPLLDFYSRPHPHLNRFQYWELRIIWLMLRGECMRVPIFGSTHSALRTPHTALESVGRGSRSTLASVLVLDPARFQHIVEDHQLIGWRYTGLGPQAPLASQVFLPEEVWFERLPNPFDFWRGLPPLYVAAMAAQTDFAAGAFMRGVIENNGDTGVIVRTDKWLSDEQQEQIVAALRERKRKAGQADRPVLLLGSAEVIKPQLSSSDLQFLENRKFSRAEICAAFGVPEEIVTTTDYAKYDVMAGARLNFIENRIAPLCSRLEAEEEVTVKSIDPRASGWFDLDSLPIMQEARRNRLAAARTGFEMGLPFNELNRVLDLGFKPLPWGDRGYLPAKLQPLGGTSPKSEARNPKSSPAAAGAGEDARGPAPASPHAEISGEENSPVVAFADPLARAQSMFTQATQTQRAPNPQLVRKLRRFFFEQRTRALASLSASAPLLLDLASENARLAGVLRPFTPAERQTEICAVNQATATALQDSLASGRAHAETADHLASRIRAIFNQLGPQHAVALAQAELTAPAGAARPLHGSAGLAPASSPGVPPRESSPLPVPEPPVQPNT